MTTIAITATEIAWDSQMTLGNERAISPIEKVRLVRPGVILCFSGDCDDEGVLEQWLRDHGHNPKKYPKFREKADFRAVIVTRKGMFEYNERSGGNGIAIGAPVCLGTGGDYARSILAANAVLGHKNSALDAVKVAGVLDIHTGPPYQHANIKKMLYARKK